MKKSIFLSLVMILIMGGSAIARLDSLRVATANLTEEGESVSETCVHEQKEYEDLGTTHSVKCINCLENLGEEAHVDDDSDMCCDACLKEISTLAPSEGEGYVESTLTLNEIIKISIKANKDEVSKIIVSSWYDIDSTKILETEAIYNDSTQLYEAYIRFDNVNGEEGIYNFDAAIYDASGNMRYLRLSEVEYVKNGISNVTTNRTPEGNIEVTVEAVEGGEIYISTNGEAPTESTTWTTYEAGETYSIEDENGEIEEIQVYYRSSDEEYSTGSTYSLRVASIDEVIVTLMQNGIEYDGRWTNKEITAVATFKGTADVTLYQYQISGDSTWYDMDSNEVAINQNINGEILIRGLDVSGNIVASQGISNTLKLDITRPTIESKGYETKERTAIIKVSGKDNLSGLSKYAIALSEEAPKTWQDVLEDEFEIAVNGSGKYYIWVKDNAGNISYVEEADIVKDIEVPTGEISVQNAYLVEGKIEYTDKNPVTLEITAKDDFSLTEDLQMAIYREEDYNALKDEDDIVWESYSGEKEWTLKNENADERVYLLLKDEAGNISAEINELEPLNAPYIVYHYIENVNDTNYTLYKTSNKIGTSRRTLNLANERINIEGTTYFKAALEEGGEAKETVKLSPDGTTKIYIYYTRNTYKLTLEMNENINSVTGADSYKYGAEVEIEAVLEEITGYTNTFVRWQSNNIGLLPHQTSMKATFKMPAGNVTLKAIAEKVAKKYTVTFNTNEDGEAPEEIEVTYGETYGTLPTVEREGCTFDGWYTEKNSRRKNNRKYNSR